MQFLLSRLGLLSTYTELQQKNICIRQSVNDGELLVLDDNDQNMPLWLKKKWGHMLRHIEAGNNQGRFYLRRLDEFPMIEPELERHYGFKLYKPDEFPRGAEDWHEHFME